MNRQPTILVRLANRNASVMHSSHALDVPLNDRQNKFASCRFLLHRNEHFDGSASFQSISLAEIRLCGGLVVENVVIEIAGILPRLGESWVNLNCAFVRSECVVKTKPAIFRPKLN